LSCRAEISKFLYDAGLLASASKVSRIGSSVLDHSLRTQSPRGILLNSKLSREEQASMRPGSAGLAFKWQTCSFFCNYIVSIRTNGRVKWEGTTERIEVDQKSNMRADGVAPDYTL
jgi:hypothetical protein